MKTALSASLLALLLTAHGQAENWTYTLQQTDLDQTGLQRFSIHWESLGQFRFGTMERNLQNQANLNFLLSGEGCQMKSCQVFIPPHCTADAEGNGQIKLAESGYGFTARFGRHEETTRVQLSCSWPELPTRSQDYVWADPDRQFVCVTDLYRPEERAVMASLPFFDILLPGSPTDRTAMIILSAVRQP